MSTFLQDSKRFSIRWAIGFGALGLLGIGILVATMLGTEWPVGVKSLIGVVCGWMIGLGIAQPPIALYEYRRDVKFEKRYHR